ncbi:hypothetical protein KAR91_09715 [Candidatus Pacearchaeota archaeon]|nr:hypothetical protein [Candidatus Pacearchaeota archaeon]
MIQHFAVGLILLDAIIGVDPKMRVCLGNKDTICVNISAPVDLQTEEQLLSWGWIKIREKTWGFDIP